MILNKLITFIGSLLLILLLMYLQSFRLPLSAYFETIYMAQPYDLKGMIKAGIFISIYLFSLVSLLMLIRSKSKIISTFSILFFAFFYSADLFVQWMGNNYAGISEGVVSLAFSEADKAENLIQFKTPITYSILSFLGLMLIFYIYRKISTLNKHGSTKLAFLSYITSIALVSGSTFAIFSITTPTFPAPIKGPILIANHYLKSDDKIVRVLAQEIKPSTEKHYKTIVWIVDESISGDYLSINNYQKETTPFLKRYQTSQESKQNFRNFGISTPISNCSNTSNLFLRIGLTTNQSNKFKILKNNLPTIFQYAKRAGYETTLIDAQTSPGQMQNHLNMHDMKSIDDYTTFTRDALPNQRDGLILSKLNKLLHQETNKDRFIVAIKWGAHWPYQLTYPLNEEKFTPAVRDSFADFSDKNKTIITNAYLNSIRFSVDQFLKKLQPNKLRSDQIILYTSDHGQSLFHKMDDNLTHCHTARDLQTLPRGEFKVPLMVFTKNANQLFKKEPNKHYNQQQMFSTTLNLMGYDQKLQKKYGPTLFEGSNLPYSESYVLDSGKKIKLK